MTELHVGRTGVRTLGEQENFLLRNIRRYVDPTQSCIRGYRRMSGAVPPLLLYAIMACTVQGQLQIFVNLKQIMNVRMWLSIGLL